MKKIKREFLLNDKSISFKPNKTTYIERYFNKEYYKNKDNEVVLCIGCTPFYVPEKITIILVYVDVSLLGNKKSISPMDINEYYIKEVLELNSSNVKSSIEGLLKISKEIGSKKLWKIKFEIKSKIGHHFEVDVMDKNYQTI